MRKITRESVDAFLNARPFKKSNMKIEVLPNVTVMMLHGNEIAYRYNDPQKTLEITNAGWRSNTTKERLNGLPGVSVNQHKWNWHLNGEQWDGSLVNVDEFVKQQRRKDKIDLILKNNKNY